MDEYIKAAMFMAFAGSMQAQGYTKEEMWRAWNAQLQYKLPSNVLDAWDFLDTARERINLRRREGVV